MAGSLNDFIKQMNHVPAKKQKSLKKDVKEPIKSKMVSFKKPARIPRPLQYDNTCYRIKTHIENRYKPGVSVERLVTDNEQRYISELTEKDRVEIEQLMYKIIRFVALFEDLLISGGKLKWNYLFYGLVMSFLNELTIEILNVQTRNPFKVVEMTDRRYYDVG